MSYFVLGLPRSRTAWLSVFLSQSGTYCHHEGINGCKTIGEYRDKMIECGDSTTGFSYIEGAYIGRPTVIIEKTAKEYNRCVEWCNGFIGEDVSRMMGMDRDRLYAIDGLRVMQSDINDRLEDIFTYLTGCEYKPQYALLTKLNIQADTSLMDVNAMAELINAKL